MILAEGSTLRIAPGNGGAEGQYTMGQRYQREIEEILLKANEDAPDDGQKRPRNPQRSARRAPPSRGRGRSLRFTSGRLLAMGVAVLAVALILNVFGVPFVTPLLWASVALVVIAYISYFTKPRRTVEKRWRGQPIEDAPGPSSLSRIWRWIIRG